MFDENELLGKAEEAMKRSYAPYSLFRVGAAVASSDGRMVIGSNYENASYSCTICAEAAAITAANAQGIDDIEAIAIIASSDEPVTPCGACRQIISEASTRCGRDILIIMSNANREDIERMRLSELLPHAFSHERK